MEKKMLMVASTKGHLKQFHLPYIAECGKSYVVDLAYPKENQKKCLEELSPNGEDIFIPIQKKYLSFSNFLALIKLVILLKRKKYDKIITHTTLASFILRFAVLLSGEKIYVICVVHGYLFHEYSSTMKKNLFLSVEKLVAMKTDLLLTMNTWDYEMATQHQLGKKIEKIPGMGVKIPDITTNNLESVGRDYHLPYDKFLVVYGGEFSSRKNQRFLIEAFRLLPEEIHLVLAGDGATLEAMIGLVKEYHMSHKVHFLGQIRNLPSLYSFADLVVSSSQSEGLPFHVMEAMAIGKNILLSDIKGHRDLLGDSEKNVLYQYEDCKDFRDKVMFYYKCYEFPKCLNLKNKEIFYENYELSVVLPEIMSYYLEKSGIHLQPV